jgi:hypothetical protein
MTNPELQQVTTTPTYPNLGWPFSMTFKTYKSEMAHHYYHSDPNLQLIG